MKMVSFHKNGEWETLVRDEGETRGDFFKAAWEARPPNNININVNVNEY